MTDKIDEGIHEKYYVFRQHDLIGKHNDCWFFVLDIKHDLLARVALRTYISEAVSLGYLKLANDLLAKLDLYLPDLNIEPEYDR